MAAAHQSSSPFVVLLLLLGAAAGGVATETSSVAVGSAGFSPENSELLGVLDKDSICENGDTCYAVGLAQLYVHKVPLAPQPAATSSSPDEAPAALGSLLSQNATAATVSEEEEEEEEEEKAAVAAPVSLLSLNATAATTSEEEEEEEGLTGEMQAVLNQHNVYRCMHGVPPLTWNAAIARNAQAWANRGVYEHSPNQARVINGVQAGQNLAWGYPSLSGVTATKNWYNEIRFTNNGIVNGFNMKTGHYTQVVWRSSKSLGCGKGKATVRGHRGDYWVCEYGPAGNFQGQFSQNVPQRQRSEGACGR